MHEMTETTLTWEAMLVLEPRLQALYEDAQRRSQAVHDRYCSLDVFSHEFKPRVIALAGFDSKIPELCTTQAYDLAYQKILDALPMCPEGGCGEHDVMVYGLDA